MKKKLLSLALALALCLGLTVPAFAAELKIVEVPTPVVEEYEGKEYSPEVFHEGLARLYVYGEGGTKIGFIDKTGKVVVPAEYDGAWDFSEGLAVVQKNNKFGCIDKTGKEVIPCQYPWTETYRPLTEFHEGLAALLKDGKYGYIDKTGEVVIPLQYHTAKDFSEGLAAVEKDDKWGYIDKTGKEVIPLQYGYASSFSEGLAAVAKYDKWVFIDKTGQEVISLQYDDVSSFSEGLAAVCKNDKWGYIDKTGEEVIPLQYDNVNHFSEGLAAVKKDGKWGYIDTTGKLVIPCKYEGGATYFSGGFAVVYDWYYDEQASKPQNRPMCGIIDRTGKEVIPPEVHTKNGAEYILLRDVSSTFENGVSRLIWYCVSDSKDFSPAYFTITVDAEVSDWAREQVDSAAVKGLMPDCLGDDFTVNITRAEFAALAVELYEAMSGETAPAPGENPFSDTDDPVVLQANALGIVKGSGGKFAPNDPVTRQEAALMLSRVYTKLGGEIPKVEKTAFADNGYVASWAMDAVAFMSDHKIVNGKGNNKFDPLGNASIQEAMVIALRMFENLQ